MPDSENTAGLIGGRIANIYSIHADYSTIHAPYVIAPREFMLISHKYCILSGPASVAASDLTGTGHIQSPVLVILAVCPKSSIPHESFV